MKLKRTNSATRAKVTSTFAVCIALALTCAAKDEEQPAKGGSSDLKSQQQSGSSSSSSQGASSQSSSQGTPGSSSSSQSGSSSSSQLSNSDRKFIQHAAKGGMMEVEMGQLGVQKAQNPQLKAYAQRLIDDHTKANTELKQLATSKGMTLPDSKIAGTSSEKTQVRESEGTSSSAEHSATASDHSMHASMKHLESLSGAEFDREFVRMAVNDHEKDVKEFEKQAQHAQDSDVKAFAQKTAPTLREHLQQAKSLQTQMGAPSSSSGSSSGSDQGSSSSQSSGQGSSSSSSGSSK